MAGFAVPQVTEGEWTSVKCVDILGVHIPAFFATDPQVLHDFISTFQTRPDDVFVVGFPKSGTTWTEEVVWQIYNQGAVDSTRVGDRVVFLEPSTNHKFMHPDINTLSSPRLMKTHLPYSAIPKSKNDLTQCKYIYVARNPKDVAVSNFYFMSRTGKDLSGFNGPWEFFVKLFIEGNVWWNFWNDHVLGWWKHKDDPNVLFIKYEDMHKDLPSHVRMIAEFLNKPLSDELLNRIAEQCTFNGMNKNADSYKLGSDFSLLRKGVVGDWKNYFTPELNDKFEKEVLAKLKGTGLEFDFEIDHFTRIY